MEIPPNLKIFKMEAIDCPESMEGCEFKPLGFIVNTTSPIASDYGDKRLFFQHARTEDDLEVRPHWEEWLDIDESTFNAKMNGGVTPL